MTETKKEYVPKHRCSCGTRWSGANICHCSGCHRTFTGLRPFDTHRQRGQCVIPDSLTEVRPGMWGTQKENDE